MKQGSEPIGTHGLVGHSSVFQLSWSHLLLRQLDGREMCGGVVAGFGSASHDLLGAVAELYAQLTLLQKLKSIHDVPRRKLRPRSMP